MRSLFICAQRAPERHRCHVCDVVSVVDDVTVDALSALPLGRRRYRWLRRHPCYRCWFIFRFLGFLLPTRPPTEGRGRLLVSVLFFILSALSRSDRSGRPRRIKSGNYFMFLSGARDLHKLNDEESAAHVSANRLCRYPATQLALSATQ